jgi:hypothetical protein
MPMSNASLLDEATAAAEAMTMCSAVARGKKTKFLVRRLARLRSSGAAASSRDLARPRVRCPSCATRRRLRCASRAPTALACSWWWATTRSLTTGANRIGSNRCRAP